MTRNFPIAPMSASIRALTLVLLALPLALAGTAIVVPQGWALAGVAAFVALLYASVWIWWRPTAFEISAFELRVCFPGRRRALPRADVRSVRKLTGREFRDEFGFAMRIGAGGLWGGFGWLWTRRRGLIEFYVSRLDGLVVVERITGRPLLITPANPDAFLLAMLPGSGPVA